MSGNCSPSGVTPGVPTGVMSTLVAVPSAVVPRTGTWNDNWKMNPWVGGAGSGRAGLGAGFGAGGLGVGAGSGVGEGGVVVPPSVAVVPVVPVLPHPAQPVVPVPPPPPALPPGAGVGGCVSFCT